MELHIGKVVLGDRGDYRLEIKAKDACDSCGFNIDVEGALVGTEELEVHGSGGGGRMSPPGTGGCGEVGPSLGESVQSHVKADKAGDPSSEEAGQTWAKRLSRFQDWGHTGYG